MIFHEEIQVNLYSTSPEITLYTNQTKKDLATLTEKLASGIKNRMKFNLIENDSKIIITKVRAKKAKRNSLGKREFLNFLNFYTALKNFEIYNVEIISGQSERYYLRSK